MSSKKLSQWSEIVKLHPDVEAGNLTEAVFAIDLGAIAAGDPNVPVVNRDPDAFFKATYLTADLRKLLEEVLASLAGKTGYNRVLKLRTPFGGGKSHTLAALFHASKSRDALKESAKQWATVHPHVAEKKVKYGKVDVIKLDDLPDPGEVRVAVFDGEKFDAREGKTVDGVKIKTMWGWLAWQIDKECYELVKSHDQDCVSPGGEVVKQILEWKKVPKLLLLDEVLKYMERAAAVAVLDSTLQRQAKDFFQTLTVEVAGSANCAMVYSLQWSARESLGNIALLQEIDKLAARVDQLREPVAGDEILPILQRRLLGAPPDTDAASETAGAYSENVTGMRRAYADTPSAKQQAEEDGLVLRDRMNASYPFHPALIDIMRERWASVDSFQRTRGALRFLASCLHSIKKNGGWARALLGPGDIPIKDVDVRMKMLKELGVQNEYDAVITTDIEGPNAKAKQIDDRLAQETPAMVNVRPATRLATAILLFSFGGLRRDGDSESETLPPGVMESELMAACVGPDLDNITATAVLSELRTKCLYLHYDGVRYCFKKDPNITKLVEDAEQEVAREEMRSKGRGPVRERIREMLNQRLAGHRATIVWPSKSQDVPDEEPQFIVAYMPLEFAEETKAEQERQGKEILSKHGDKFRKYRNGLGVAVPDKKQIESLRRAVRYLLAVEKVEAKKQQHRLSKDQMDQLKERRRTEEAAAESGFRGLYTAVWLPRVESGEIEVEKVEIGGRPLMATGVHERIMELLTGMGTSPKVHGKLFPNKIVEKLKLGEAISEGEPPRLGVKVSEVIEAFFCFLEPPRLDSAQVIKKGIVKGIADGVFAYTSGTIPKLGDDGKYQVSLSKVIFSKTISEEEIDLETGFIFVPSAIPSPEIDDGTGDGPAPIVEPPVDGTGGKKDDEPVDVGGGSQQDMKKVFQMKFKATRDQVFKAFPAIANLADKSDDGKVSIQIDGYASEGFDSNWLRNAVEEPLDEADVEKE